MPLELVENQQYIHYRKGSLVLYARKDQLGEEKLNQALRRYIASANRAVDSGFILAPDARRAVRDAFRSNAVR